MEGILRQRRAPQVIRSFAPTRLAGDLLAGVYECLLTVGGQDSASQNQVMERGLQELPLGEERPVTTGGR